MRLCRTNRVLIFAALSLLVVLPGNVTFGQGAIHPAPVATKKVPPLGLGLGHASYEQVLDRIVDRSSGHVAVDPNSLHPAALSPDANGFVWHAPKPYTCWMVEADDPGDYAPGTVVACYVDVSLADEFVNGDGSLLADIATGKPDDFFGFDCPQGFAVKDYTRDRWRAVRYFDSAFNHIGTIRANKYAGLNYNYTTGKSVKFQAHYIEIDTMQPVDGTADYEYSKFLGDDYGPVTGEDGQVLADSFGRVDYTPGLASILYIKGHHPLDAFYAGDPTGILPVCDALK